jgi:putative DNA primase/helicase
MSNKIPKIIRAIPQWVGWKIIIDKNGRIKKMPVNPNLKVVTPASVTDPSTWSTYTKAKEACQKLNLDGVGFVFRGNDPFVGIDLDDCKDSETGKIDKWARDIIRDMDSYTEISPSGTGVHIIIKGKLPAGGLKGDDVEIYDRRRYFTVTGEHLKDTPLTINRRDAQLQNLIDKYFTEENTMISNTNQQASNGFSDAEIIKKAKEAKREIAKRNRPSITKPQSMENINWKPVFEYMENHVVLPLIENKKYSISKEPEFDIFKLV